MMMQDKKNTKLEGMVACPKYGTIHITRFQRSYTQMNDQPISALTFRALEWLSGRAVALCTQGRGFESHRLQLVSAKSLKVKMARGSVKPSTE